MIRCKELTKYFTGTRALDGCSFEISEPGITGVIGVNGAGKTTLFKSIAGFLKPTNGEVYVLEEPAFQNITVAQNVILIEEGMNFYQSGNLQELMDTYSRFYLNYDMKLAKGLLRYFNLSGALKYDELSKGMASTFRLILALSARAPITLLDEPTSGMDPGVRKDLYDIILKDFIQVPRMILISSHYLGEMERILENILFIHEGKVLKHGALEEFETLLIAIQGAPSLVRSLEDQFAVYETKDIGEGLRRIVVEKSEFDHSKIAEELRASLTIQEISPEDSFVYLTRRKGGGIDELYHS